MTTDEPVTDEETTTVDERSPQRTLRIAGRSTLASRARDARTRPEMKKADNGAPAPSEPQWNCKFSSALVDGKFIDSRPIDPEETP